MAARDHPLRRLLAYSKPHRGRMVLASTCSVLNKLFDLAPPLLIGAAVEVVVEREASFLAGWGVSDPVHQLWVLAAATLVIWGLESVFQYAYGVLWRNLAQTVQHDLRLDAYEHVQTLEMVYFEDRTTGDLLAVLNDDVNQLERFLDHGATEILHVMTTVIVISTLFFVIAPSVAWMAMLPMPFILWGSFRFQRWLAPRYATVRDQAGRLAGDLANNLGGIATIKSFTAEAREVERIGVESDRYREANRAAIRLSSAFTPLIRMVIVIGFTAMIVFAGIQVLEGRLATGLYAVMVFMTQRLLWPLTRLGETMDLYQRAMASTNRVLDLLDTPARIVGGSERLPLGEIRGDVEFDDVQFAYHPDVPVLDHLTLTAPAGATTAIVGATGSGKTTVIKLLLRYYDVDGGAVRVDGHDVRELVLADLRAGVGLVSQDVFLFPGSVRENIAYGRPDATAEEILEAARIAEADAFIRALPRGYETVIGERGQKLSGGQRQRVSLARAVLKDPPILVLDEATSSVDNETEAAIQRSMERIGRDRTVIVIAHRLSTVRRADRIHVLAAGRLEEVGTHDELVARGGLYATLWNVQTGLAVAQETP